MTPACTADGWCWENPLPQGNQLRGATTLASGDSWVVGWGGTVLHWDGSSWTGSAAITPNRLNAVWASANNDVWAVGGGGTIMHWNGTAWTSSPSTTTQELLGIWGTSPTNLWAVGRSGTVLGWNGTAWSAATVSATTDLRGVWGAAANDVWVVGDQVILHWNGTAWSATTVATDQSAVWGTSSTNVWTVGTTNGSLRRWSGAAWNASSSSVVGSAIYGTSTNDIWIVNTQLETFHFNGTAWSSSSIATGGWHIGMYGITGAANGELLAVGDDGVMYRRTGGAWHLATQGILELLPERIQFGNLAAASATDVLASGMQYSSSTMPQHGYVMKRTAGGVWEPSFNQTPPDIITSISASSPTNAWAVGSSHRILQFDGTSWAVSNSLANQTMAAVATLGNNDVWAAGGDRTHRWNGSVWSDIPNPVNVTSVTLSVLEARASNDVWAGGSNGTLLRWNGTAWSAIPSGVTAKIGCLTAPSADFALACAGGGLLRWNGSTWTSGFGPAGYTVWAAWAESATSVWAIAGKDWKAYIFRWNGTTWEEAGGGIAEDLILRDLDGAGGNLWVLGEGGRVLRHP